ncbi:unnamed protein product [Sphagnum jensenii]|uniref:Uncharacterized protein n=1 Tax=Sphagnum jensenii TaxID=128206 RepID=A0ABP1BBS9_9BRYO
MAVVHDDNSDYSNKEYEAMEEEEEEEDENEEEEDENEEEQANMREGGEHDDVASDGDDDEEGNKILSVTKKAQISINLNSAKVCKVRVFVVTFSLCAH